MLPQKSILLKQSLSLKDRSRIQNLIYEKLPGYRSTNEDAQDVILHVAPFLEILTGKQFEKLTITPFGFEQMIKQNLPLISSKLEHKNYINLSLFHKKVSVDELEDNKASIAYLIKCMGGIIVKDSEADIIVKTKPEDTPDSIEVSTAYINYIANEPIYIDFAKFKHSQQKDDYSSDKSVSLPKKTRRKPKLDKSSANSKFINSKFENTNGTNNNTEEKKPPTILELFEQERQLSQKNPSLKEENKISYSHLPLSQLPPTLSQTKPSHDKNKIDHQKEKKVQEKPPHKEPIPAKPTLILTNDYLSQKSSTPSQKSVTSSMRSATSSQRSGNLSQRSANSSQKLLSSYSVFSQIEESNAQSNDRVKKTLREMIDGPSQATKQKELSLSQTQKKKQPKKAQKDKNPTKQLTLNLVPQEVKKKEPPKVESPKIRKEIKEKKEDSGSSSSILAMIDDLKNYRTNSSDSSDDSSHTSIPYDLVRRFSQVPVKDDYSDDDDGSRTLTYDEGVIKNSQTYNEAGEDFLLKSIFGNSN
ncbi:hypothetical protein TVAG_191390 [Trichomonas vaginalis G3]|uniref:BRCT domain-containing protein n=1 Tax=Trichomonas vaginalis (strain ATCC PRA-98 / G3) TaxID=412133 RepID=A2EQJ5_TRIV3|nr:hypothetical protein TVAGG3_0976360 [Trichomonas vaginalis G3]EAY05042.1 hypothetical protein TVAG_191390 [Trichomonas vaginalis G3]KAI5488959.1 hypothetical protein TVAGG3_0976360 [Trichomonas vaginalis G3]|eukprot:XP_001317265.1 hypothetical protein [Trichomonas vaginalis G3]